MAAEGETKKVYLDNMPDRAVIIGANLNAEEDKDLVRFLNRNKEAKALVRGSQNKSHHQPAAE
jgi:hypothetical protein